MAHGKPSRELLENQSGDRVSGIPKPKRLQDTWSREGRCRKAAAGMCRGLETFITGGVQVHKVKEQRVKKK